MSDSSESLVRYAKLVIKKGGKPVLFFSAYRFQVIEIEEFRDLEGTISCKLANDKTISIALDAIFAVQAGSDD